MHRTWSEGRDQHLPEGTDLSEYTQNSTHSPKTGKITPVKSHGKKGCLKQKSQDSFLEIEGTNISVSWFFGKAFCKGSVSAKPQTSLQTYQLYSGVGNTFDVSVNTGGAGEPCLPLDCPGGLLASPDPFDHRPFAWAMCLLTPSRFYVRPFLRHHYLRNALPDRPSHIKSNPGCLLATMHSHMVLVTIVIFHPFLGTL